MWNLCVCQVRAGRGVHGVVLIVSGNCFVCQVRAGGGVHDVVLTVSGNCFVCQVRAGGGVHDVVLTVSGNCFVCQVRAGGGVHCTEPDGEERHAAGLAGPVCQGGAARWRQRLLLREVRGKGQPLNMFTPMSVSFSYVTHCVIERVLPFV